MNMDESSSSKNATEVEHTVSTTFDESIDIIFGKDNKMISSVSVNGIEDTSDMFWFLTKLLKQGLVHVFSKENGDLDLDTLSSEDFSYINSCMNKVGVAVELQVIPCAVENDNLNLDRYLDNTSNLDLNVAMSYAVYNSDFAKLENHVLFLFTKTRKFVIRYTKL